MAYHIGRILQECFGYELVEAQTYPGRLEPIFHYDEPVPTVTLEQMERQIRDDDLLVANPAFSSFMFGLRLKGHKIMYVQDFRTFSLLDCHFDLYVSVSSVVRDFLRATYGLDTAVIPAFIPLERMPEAAPWHERPPYSFFVHCKMRSRENEAVFDLLRRQLHKADSRIVIEEMQDGYRLPQDEFLRTLGASRYLLNISIAEGFGLVPLEAMAMGTVVLGLDGLSGRDYMRRGENCLTYPFAHIKELPAAVAQLMQDDAKAEQLSQAGMKTAMQYGYAPFRERWVAQLARFLNKAPA